MMATRSPARRAAHPSVRQRVGVAGGVVAVEVEAEGVVVEGQGRQS